MSARPTVKANAPAGPSRRSFSLRAVPWGWFLGWLWFNAVTLSVGTYYAQLQWQAYALWVGLGAVAIAVGGGGLVFREGELKGFGHGIDLWLVGAFVGLGLISWHATDAARSWLAVSQCLLYAWIGYAALQPFSRSPQRAATFIAAGLAAMLTATYVIHGFFHSFWDIAVTPMAANLVWPIGHWNFLGSFICLTWPLAAAKAFQGRGSRAAWFWGAVTLLGAWSVARSGSRSSLVALLIQVAVLAWWGRHQGLAQLRRVPAWVLTLFGGLGLLVALVRYDVVVSLVSRLWGLGIAVVQMASGTEVTEISAGQRWDMWQGGVRGLMQEPWLGHGLGSVPTQFLHYQPANPRWGDVAIPQLHNTFVHLSFEGGVMLLALVLLGALLLLRMLRRIEGIGDGGLRQVGQAAALGLFGYLICLQADFHWQVPSLTLTLVMVVALVGALTGPVRLNHPGWRIGAGFLALPLFFAAVRLWLPAIQAHQAYDQGRHFLESRQPEAALKAWETAMLRDPTTLFYRLARGNLLHAEALIPQPPRRDLLVQAHEDFKVINARAALASSLLKEGAIALQLGNPEGAIEPLDRAVRYIPYSGAAHYLLGMAYVHGNQRVKAIESLSRALACAPVLTDSTFLHDPLTKTYRLPAIQGAEKIIRHWLAQSPDAPELAYRLGRMLEAQGETEDARYYYEKALATATNTVEEGRLSYLAGRIGHALALLDLAAGKPERVLKRYEAVLAKGSVEAPSLVLVAWAQAALGKSDVARQMAEQALVPMRNLMPDLTAATLADRAKFAETQVTISLDRRDVWIIQSFRKLAPPIFHTSLTFKSHAAFVPDEVMPWPYLPKAAPFGKARP